MPMFDQKTLWKRILFFSVVDSTFNSKEMFNITRYFCHQSYIIDEPDIVLESTEMIRMVSL